MAARRIPNPKAGGSNPSGVMRTCFIFCPPLPARGPDRHADLTPVPVAQLDKASDYESEDWGFESLQG